MTSGMPLSTRFIGRISVFSAGDITGTLYSTVGETSYVEAFVRELAQRVPQHGDALMTIAQRPEQKGIQPGEQRGIEKANPTLPVPCCRTASTATP